MTTPESIEISIKRNTVNIVSIDVSEFEVVDIRELHEQPRLPQEVCGYECWPLSEFEDHVDKIDPEKKYLFFCQAGVRTQNLIHQLHRFETTNTFSLEGGVFAFQHLMDN